MFNLACCPHLPAREYMAGPGLATSSSSRCGRQPDGLHRASGDGHLTPDDAHDNRDRTDLFHTCGKSLFCRGKATSCCNQRVGSWCSNASAPFWSRLL